eukprot:jgi/Botrbrau1/17569/Bobra.0166s0016.1
MVAVIRPVTMDFWMDDSEQSLDLSLHPQDACEQRSSLLPLGLDHNMEDSKPADLAPASTFLQSLPSDPTPASGAGGVDDEMQDWDHMATDGSAPDVHTFTSLLDGGLDPDGEGDLFGENRDAGIADAPASAASTPPVDDACQLTSTSGRQTGAYPEGLSTDASGSELQQGPQLLPTRGVPAVPAPSVTAAMPLGTQTMQLLLAPLPSSATASQPIDTPMSAHPIQQPPGGALPLHLPQMPQPGAPVLVPQGANPADPSMNPILSLMQTNPLQAMLLQQAILGTQAQLAAVMNAPSTAAALPGHPLPATLPAGQASSALQSLLTAGGAVPLATLAGAVPLGTSMPMSSPPILGAGPASEPLPSQSLPPLSASASAQAPTASPGGEEGPDAKKRKRRTDLPRTRAGQRCGTCHTCRNPQFKKACETRRAEALAAAAASGAETSGVSNGTSRTGSGDEPQPDAKPAADGKRHKPNTAAADYATLDSASTQPPAAPEPPAGAPQGPGSPKQDDRFTRDLQEIANRSGGLRDASCVPRFEKLMEEAATLNARKVLLTMINQSHRSTLSALVHSKGLGILEEWLNQARQSDRHVKFVAKILASLKNLPVDLQGLKSCTIGKRVSNLAKKGPPEYQEAAAALVAAWKKAVDAEQSGPDKEGAKKAGPKKAEGQGNGFLAHKNSLELKKAPAGSKPAAGPPAGGQPLAAVDDGLMFMAKPKPKLPPLAPRSSGEIKKIKVLDAAQATKVAKEKAEEAKKIQEALKKKGKPGEVGTGGLASGETSGPSHPAGDLAGDPNSVAAPNNANTSALARPPFQFSNLTQNITRIGGLGTAPLVKGPGGPPLSYPQDAAARAAAARARIPSPEPPEHKEKAKTVSWVAEEHLVSFRVFRKDDPPIVVRQQGGPEMEGKPGLAMEGGSHPPGFLLAARKEHTDEALHVKQLLSQKQVSEEEEGGVVEGIVDSMYPDMWWPEGGAPAAALPEEIAGGEESEAAREEALREQGVQDPYVWDHSSSQVLVDPREAPQEDVPFGQPVFIPLQPLTPARPARGRSLGGTSSTAFTVRTSCCCTIYTATARARSRVPARDGSPSWGRDSWTWLPGSPAPSPTSAWSVPWCTGSPGAWSTSAGTPCICSPRASGACPTNGPTFGWAWRPRAPWGGGPPHGEGPPGPHQGWGAQGTDEPRPSSAGRDPGDRGPPPRLCSFFNTPRGCRNGDQCRFAHIRGLGRGPCRDPQARSPQPPARLPQGFPPSLTSPPAAVLVHARVCL